MNVELPDTFSIELRQLLEGLLQVNDREHSFGLLNFCNTRFIFKHVNTFSLKRDVDKRLGCRGGGSEELKNHAFFHGVDWNQVYQQKYPPPLIPPRGEVNAADAFDIGSFDEEDTKGKRTRLERQLIRMALCNLEL